MKEVTAIFDIGKTNKKFFLFDKKFKQVHKTYQRFEAIQDEDGYRAENLPALQNWTKSLFDEILSSSKYDIKAINFSAYGASFVHIDHFGKPVCPLYDYTKPIDAKVIDHFFEKYGDLRQETGSPDLGFLSSGLQLFWLKHYRKEAYEKIKYSLHFPQYMSYLLTGIPVSEFTSIGCHTMLWDYQKKDYHDWVYAEGIDKKLAPIVPTSASINMNYEGRQMKIGMGIHDSSAALIPYLKTDKKPFLLISTGTWSVTLNPFTQDEELRQSPVHYLRPDGKPVKATKVFLGNEYKEQVAMLTNFYGVGPKSHQGLKFSEKTYLQLIKDEKPKFRFQSIEKRENEPSETDLCQFPDLETAYHQLMIELMKVQISSSQKSKGSSEVNKIYIDGGFTDNDIFVKLVSYHFRNCKVRTTESPLGSALGAALVISDKVIDKKFLKDNYNLKKHKPLILQSV